MKNQTIKNGVKNNNWGTPQYLLDYIKKEFFYGNDFFDPCPYNPDYKVDGLKIDWGKYTFVNPPYTTGDKEKFVKKCYEEYKKGKHIVLLIPAATETQNFFKYIYPYARVYLLEKRIKFYGYNTKGEWVNDRTGQSGSALCVFNPEEKMNFPFIKPLNYKEYSIYKN